MADETGIEPDAPADAFVAMLALAGETEAIAEITQTAGASLPLEAPATIPAPGLPTPVLPGAAPRRQSDAPPSSPSPDTGAGLPGPAPAPGSAPPVPPRTGGADTDGPGVTRVADVAPGAPTGREWVIELPAGLALLSLNGREHHMARHRTFQSLKKAAWAMALNARLPHLERVSVEAVYDPPDRRHRDPDNLAASLKPCIDALVAAKVIPADDSRYVASATCSVGAKTYPRGRLRIIVREVTA